MKLGYAARRLLAILALILLAWSLKQGRVDRAVEWFVALGIVTLCFHYVRRLEATAFDNAKDRWWLFFLLVLAFLGTWFLKWLHVAVAPVGDGSFIGSFGYVWCRKFNDISFWVMLIGSGVAFGAVSCTIRVPRSQLPALRWVWYALGLLSVASYLYIVGIREPGTFFWQPGPPTSSDAIVKLIQVLEGALIVFFLLGVHLVHSVYLISLAHAAKLTPFANPRMAVSPLFFYGWIAAILGAGAQLWPYIEGFCTEASGRYLGDGNYRYTKDYPIGKILLYGLAVAWPFALPGVVWLIGWIYGTIAPPAPPSPPAPPPAPSPSPAPRRDGNHP